MARPVSNASVQTLVPGTTIDFTAFIPAANVMVDNLAASFCGSDLSESTLEIIEQYLSVHYASGSNPSLSYTSEKVEGTSVTASRGNVGIMSGIMGTQWGQMANSLSSGCLQELELRKPKVDFF